MISKTCPRYIPGKALAYLKHISGISQAHLRHTSESNQAHLRLKSGESQVNQKNIADVAQAYLKLISGKSYKDLIKCHANLRHTSGKSMQSIYKPGKSLVYLENLQYISGNISHI